jgi:dolichol kinase
VGVRINICIIVRGGFSCIFVDNVLTLPFRCRMLFYFSSLGYIQLNLEEALGKLVLVALAATVVECISVTDVVDDNISVPLATMLVASVLFGSSAH